MKVKKNATERAKAIATNTGVAAVGAEKSILGAFSGRADRSVYEC